MNRHQCARHAACYGYFAISLIVATTNLNYCCQRPYADKPVHASDRIAALVSAAAWPVTCGLGCSSANARAESDAEVNRFVADYETKEKARVASLPKVTDASVQTRKSSYSPITTATISSPSIRLGASERVGRSGAISGKTVGIASHVSQPSVVGVSPEVADYIRQLQKARAAALDAVASLHPDHAMAELRGSKLTQSQRNELFFSTEEGIIAIIHSYMKSMRKITPPQELREFHEDIIFSSQGIIDCQETILTATRQGDLATANRAKLHLQTFLAQSNEVLYTAVARAHIKNWQNLLFLQQ